MADEPRVGFSDEEILTQLGSAVLLSWDELPAKARLKVLDQANDMIGITLIRIFAAGSSNCYCVATGCSATACGGSPFSPQSGCGIPRAISQGGG